MKNFYCQFSAFFLCLLTVTQFGYATSLCSDVKNPLKDRNKVENIPAKDKKEIGGKNDRPKKEDIPVNPSKPKRKNTVILPVVSPANTEDVKGITTSLALLPMKGIQPLITNLSTQKMVGPDPFRFTITSNKDSISVGEDIELTVTVDWVDFGVNNGVRFLPEWYKYALKVVMPKGFLQTGGDYTDYCTKPVDANNPQAVFTIKGKFEYPSEDVKFLVLRGFEGADNLSGFVFKGEKNINIFTNKNNKNSRVAARGDYEFLNISKTKCGNERYISGEIKYTGSITGANRNIDVAYHVNGDCKDYTPYTLPPSISNPTVTVSLNNTNTATFLIQFNNSSFPTAFNVFNGTENTGSNHLDIKSVFELNNNVYCNIAGNDLPITTYETPVATRVGYNTLSVSGCVSPSIVTWDNGAGSGNPVNPTPNITTTYKAKCTTNGCESVWSNGVTVSCSATIPTVTNNQNICFGTGISFTSTSGHTYSLEWLSPGGNFTNLLSYPHVTGHYRIKATGCSATVFGYSNEFDVTVNAIPAKPTLTAEQSSMAYNQNDSAIPLTATVSTGNSLRWYTVATGGTASTSAPVPSTSTVGTFYYYVSQTNGTCESNREVITVVVSDGPIIGPDPCVSLQTPTINGSSGCDIVTLTSSVTANSYVWSWGDESARTTTVNSFNATSTDTYTLTIYRTGCPTGKTSTPKLITVTVTQAPILAATKTRITNGESTTLSASNCSGTITWDNNLGTGINKTVLPISTITYKATCAANGCISVPASIIITVGQPDPCDGFSVDATVTKTTCGGSNGIILATTSGGTSPFQYKNGSTGTYQNSATFSNLATGSYTIYVKDNQNCEKSVTKSVGVSNGPDEPMDVAGGNRRGSGSVNVVARCTSGTVTWYNVSVGGSSISTGSPYSPNFTTEGEYYYYVSCKDATTQCESGRKEANVSVLPIISDPCLGNPASPSTTDDSRAGAGTITVRANCSTAESTTQWYASNLSTDTFVLWSGNDYSTSISTTTTFYASCKKGTCETSRVGATAKVTDISNPSPCAGNTPSAPSVTSGSREGTGSVNIYAACGGNITRWYANSSGGSPLKTANSSTDDVFNTPSISANTVFYAVCLNNDGCESGRTGVVAIILPPCSITQPIPPACYENSREGAGSVTIYASCTNQSDATTRWYDSNNRWISNNYALTVTVGVTTSYLASCVKGECESSRSGVRAIINPCATAKPAPTGKGNCGPGTFNIYASCVGKPTFLLRWYDAENGGNLLRQTDQNDNRLAVTISSSRLYYASCVNPTNFCESERTGVWALVIPSTIATTTNKEVCNGTAINLNVTNTESFTFVDGNNALTKTSVYEWKGPNSYVSDWQSPTIPSAQTIHGGLYTAKVINTYSHLVINGSSPVCTATAVANVTVYQKPTNAPTFSLPSICRGVSGLLTVNNCTAPNTVLWYSSMSATTPVGNGTTYPVLIPDNQNSQTYFADCSSNAELQCNSPRKDQVLTPLPSPAAPTNAKANRTNVCIGSTVTLSGSCPTGQTIQWFNAGGTAMSVLSFNHTAVGTYKYYAGCQDNTTNCKTQVANRKEVTVTVAPFPAAPSGASISATTIFCQDPIPTFNGTCATGQTLRWFTNPTGLGGIITTEPGIYDYYLACQDNVSQCSTIEANRVKVTLEVKSSAPAPVISKLGLSGITILNLYPKQATYLEATGCAGCSVEWYEKVGGIYQIIPYENTAFLSIQKATAGTYNYKAKYKKDNCAGELSNELIVTVAPCPDLVIQQPSPSYVCEDQTIELIVSTTQKGDGTTYQWFSQIQMEDSGPLLSAPTYSKRDNYFAPEGTFFVKSCLAEDGEYYGVSTPVEVKTMYVKPEITPNEVVLIEGANLSLTGADVSAVVAGQTLAYRWIEPVVSGATLTNNTFSIPNITATKQGVYALTIKKTIGTKECTNTKDVNVYVNALTCTIDFGDAPIYACENGRGKITVNVTNTSAGKTVYYQIDGGAWQTNNEFSNLSDGDYKIDIMERSTSLEYGDPTACMAISGSRTVTVECRLPQTEGTLLCGDFKVESVTSVVAGTPVTLTARGCGGGNTIYWSNGVSNRPSITVIPTELTTYSARCEFGNESSGGSALVATLGLAKYCLSTQQIKVVAAGGPDDLPPLIPIPPCPKCNATITVTPAIAGSIPANLVWRNLSYSYSDEIKEEINPIEASSIAVSNINSKFWYSLKNSVTNINKYASLKVDACVDGVVSWKNQRTKNVINGEEIYVRPKFTTTYEVTCVMPSKETCTKTQEVKVQNYIEDCSSTDFSLNTPVVSGTGTAKTTTLSATGCSATGAVISWYKVYNDILGFKTPPNTENNLRIGKGVSITVPYEEVRYNAECFFPTGGTSVQAKLCKKFVNVGGVCENFVLTYAVSNEFSTVDATGCTGGTISWYDGTTLKSTGSRNPINSNTTKYTVKCSSSGCEKIVTVFANLKLTKTRIDCRKVQLDIVGTLSGWKCETGLIWTKRSGYNNDIVLSSKSLSVVYNRDEDPTFAKYYLTAECNDQYVKFKITFPSGNRPNKISDLAFFDVVKGDMINDFSALDRSKTVYKPDVNSSFDLSALGCYDDDKFYNDNTDGGLKIDRSAAGTVTWSIVGLDASKYKVYTSTLPEKNGRLIQFKNVDSDFTYTATCKYPDGKICTVQKEIKINFCPSFRAYATKNEIVKGEKTGLFADNCSGTLTWKNLTNKTSLKPISDGCGGTIVGPSTTSTYQAFCTTSAGKICESNEVKIEVIERPVNYQADCGDFVPTISYCKPRISGEPCRVTTTCGLGYCSLILYEDLYKAYPYYINKPPAIKRNLDAVLSYGGCDDGEVLWYDISFGNPGRLLSNDNKKFTTSNNRKFLAVCKKCDSYCSKEIKLEVYEGDTPCDGISVIQTEGSYIPGNPGGGFMGFTLEVEGCDVAKGEIVTWYNKSGKILSYQLVTYLSSNQDYFVTCTNRQGAPTCRIEGNTGESPEEESTGGGQQLLSVNGVNTTNATAALVPCGNISNADAMKGYITHLLINFLNDKATMTLAEAKAFLQLVVQTLCNDATLKASGIVIPCTLVIDDATAQKLIDKKYGEVAAALTASLGGNVPIVNYNKNAVPEYTAIYNALLKGLKMQLKESVEPYIAKLLKEIKATTIIGKDANNAYSLDKVKVFISLLQTVMKDNSVLKSKAYQLTFTSEALATLAQMYIDGKYDELAKKLAELMTQQITANDDVNFIQPTYPDVLKAIIDQTKGFVAYNGKEYKTGDILPIALASSVGAPSNTINLTAMFAPLKDVKTKLKWSNASATSDKTIATYKRNSTTSLTGEVVSVTNPFNNEVITINVVVIELSQFDENGVKTGFDPNTSKNDEYEKFYSSYKLDGSKNVIKWKSVINGSTNEAKFVTDPVGAEKYLTFKVDKTSSFTLTSTNNILTINPIAPFKIEGSINGEINAESIITPLLNVRSVDKVLQTSLDIIYAEEENDDVNDIKVNEGKANIVCIQKGPDGILNSIPDPKDQIVNGEITTGADGIRQTVLLGDDVIANGITKIGNGLPNSKGVSWGANKFRDTIEMSAGKGGGDDKLVIDSVTGEEYFDTGANGICETKANDININNILINKVDLEIALREVYEQQTGIKFNSINFISVLVNYDFNRDTKLSRFPSYEYTLLASKLNFITDPIANAYKMNSPTIVLINEFLQTQTNGDLNGAATFAGSNLIIMRSDRPSNSGSIYTSFVHEIGHAVFSLLHPWMDFSKYPNRDGVIQPQPSSQYDKLNLMDYETPGGTQADRKYFRKYQWELINK